jgi:hypothetical protein
MPAEIWAIFMLCLQQMLCVVPMHVNETFSSFSHRKCALYQKFILLEPPDRHEISIHGSNTSMLLTTLEYTEVFWVATQPKLQRIKVSGIMQASWLSLHIPSSVDPKSGSQADNARTHKDIGVFRPWQWLTGVIATKNTCQGIQKECFK